MKTNNGFSSFLALFLTFICLCAKASPLGLVLSGGGAKGAYEVGVWQVLAEAGLTNRIAAISGTSVGAINAAIFATQPEAAETLWMDNLPGLFIVSTNRIRGIATQTLSVAGDIAKPGLSPSERAGKMLSVANGLLSYPMDALLSDRIHAGFLDTDILCGILATNLPSQWSSSIPAIYATALKKPVQDCETHSWYLNDEPFERKLLILRASAAVPEAYDNVSIDGCTYIDGGWDLLGGGNAPIKPILTNHKHIGTVIVVYLDDQIDFPSFDLASRKTVFKKEDGPALRNQRHRVRQTLKETGNENVKLVEIIPSEKIAGFLYVGGFFDSSPKTARRLIDLGIKDARNQLKAAGLLE